MLIHFSYDNTKERSRVIEILHNNKFFRYFHFPHVSCNMCLEMPESGRMPGTGEFFGKSLGRKKFLLQVQAFQVIIFLRVKIYRISYI